MDQQKAKNNIVSYYGIYQALIDQGGELMKYYDMITIPDLGSRAVFESN